MIFFSTFVTIGNFFASSSISLTFADAAIKLFFIIIKYFNIIYEAIDHVEKSLSGLLEPEVKETILGNAEIQKIFKVSNAGKIAGSKVISGEIKSKSKARIIRDGVVIYSGEILSIFREKNQVKEVGTGLECGISLKDFIDFKEKDVIESYLSEKIQRSI